MYLSILARGWWNFLDPTLPVKMHASMLRVGDGLRVRTRERPGRYSHVWIVATRSSILLRPTLPIGRGSSRIRRAMTGARDGKTNKIGDDAAFFWTGWLGAFMMIREDRNKEIVGRSTRSDG